MHATIISLFGRMSHFHFSYPDPLQADWVMTAAVTACMAANIITIKEGVAGFANEGVLTVVVSNI